MVLVKEKKWTQENDKKVLALIETLEYAKERIDTDKLSKTAGANIFSRLDTGNPTLQELRQELKEADAVHYKLQNVINQDIATIMSGKPYRPKKDVLKDLQQAIDWLKIVLKKYRES